MRFILSDDQREFRRVAREFFSQRLPLEQAVARVDAVDRDRTGWRAMVDQLGVHALLAPEERGGLGGSFLDLAMVLEEAGRALADLPLMSTTAVAGETLLRAISVEQDGPAVAILDRLIEAATMVVAFPGYADEEDPSPSARLDDDGQWRVTGRYPNVLHAPDADVVLAFARSGEDRALYAVDAASVGVVAPSAALDATRSLGDVTLASTPATLVAVDGSGEIHAHALAAARVALALDSVGGARHCLELAVDYAGTREQFGKPIGSFQAIKHKCADMLLRVEAATSAAEAAAWTLSTDRDDRDAVDRAAVLAKAYACDAYVAVSGDLIQVLGGIGFTWEHPAHLFFKRAKANALMLGTLEDLRQSEAVGLGLLEPSQHLS